MRRRQTATQFEIHDMACSLLERARRARRKGDNRKAMVALREACLAEENDAILWCMYGASLAEVGRYEDAQRAYEHALWLRKHEGDERRVQTLRHVLETLHTRTAALVY